MRRVADPHGIHWNVDVAWTDIRFWSTFRRKRRARRAKREASASSPVAEETEPKNGGGWLDIAGEFLPDDFPGILAVLAVVALIVVAVITFPWLLVLFLDLVELLFFPLVAIAIVAWRVLRKRPFTITAVRWEERVAEWNVVGVREARRVERAVADAIVAGGDPIGLFPDYATRRYD